MKPDGKRSFLNNVGLFLGARKKFLNDFKSSIFLIKNLDEIPLPEPAAAPEPAPNTKKSKTKKKYYYQNCVKIY